MNLPLSRLAPGLVLALTIIAAPYGYTQNTASSASAGELNVEELATLEFPWGMVMLPDERLLITEKPGRLRIWENGNLSEPVSGVPEVVYRPNTGDQGGLLDVELDPDFESNNLVYLSYVEASEQQPANISDTGDARFAGFLDLSDNIIRGGAVARGRLQGNEIQDLEVIWRQTPKTIGRGHFGHRLVFAPDGNLFITSGDRMRFDPAQNMNSNLGKVLRISPDGSTPEDNPFADEGGVNAQIWSAGHRNILAAAIEPQSEQLWGLEMGPLGGDELNLIQEGENYGWPVVSNGSDYGGQTITGHPASDQFQAPVRSWTPVISPSGAVFYDGELFSAWQGSLLVGGLSSQTLVRLQLDGERVAVEERIDMQRRIRDVIVAADGAILALVDAAEGGLLQVTPVE